MNCFSSSTIFCVTCVELLLLEEENNRLLFRRKCENVDEVEEDVLLLLLLPALVERWTTCAIVASFMSDAWEVYLGRFEEGLNSGRWRW
jgi:hypothetical protein